MTARSITGRKAVYFGFVFILLNLLVLEVSLRVALIYTQEASFFKPSDLFKHVYPELKRDLGNGKEKVRILILGGSVLNPEWSPVQRSLEAKLRKAGLTNFHISNLSQDGHGTRDSLLKYEALPTKNYDVVVVYHAINDVVANNCPPEKFRTDYSHYSGYELRNTAARHLPFIDYSVSPYCVEYAYRIARQKFFLSQYIPLTDFRHQSDWLKYGGDIKTESPFKQNIEKLVQSSIQNKSSVILLSFATYVPSNYSYDAFMAAALDYSYSEHSCNIEVWGTRGNVVKGIAVHNAAIRAIAEHDKKVLLLDMENKIPKSGKCFMDICHLSEEGADRFAAELAPQIMKVVRQRLHAPDA